jgi:hypothetical protein
MRLTKRRSYKNNNIINIKTGLNDSDKPIIQYVFHILGISMKPFFYNSVGILESAKKRLVTHTSLILSDFVLLEFYNAMISFFYPLRHIKFIYPLITFP